MRIKLVVLLAAFLLGACGAIKPSPSEPEDDMQQPPGAAGVASAEELRIYIEQMKPEAVSHIRYVEPLRWRALNPFYAITETRNGPHLIEMSWECKELMSQELYMDMADRRSKRGILRARIDTLKGCRIANFYKLPEPDPEAVSPAVPETETEPETN